MTHMAELAIGLVGPGLVGKALLTQIQKQVAQEMYLDPMHFSVLPNTGGM